MHVYRQQIDRRVVRGMPFAGGERLDLNAG